MQCVFRPRFRHQIGLGLEFSNLQTPVAVSYGFERHNPTKPIELASCDERIGSGRPLTHCRCEVGAAERWSSVRWS